MNEHPGLRHLPLPLLVYVFTDCTKRGKKGPGSTNGADGTGGTAVFFLTALFVGESNCLPFYMKD